MAQRIGWRKWIGATIAALGFVASLSVASFADLRIVTESDDERSEMLIKGNLILSRTDAENWIIVDCKLEEVTFVSYGRYWVGPSVELKTTLENQINELSQGAGDTSEALGFLGGLFGGSQSGTTQVRVTQLADETVAGYSATQYHVETGSDSKWTTHELISVSSALLREVEAEISGCMSVMIDFTQQMAALVPLGDTRAVYNDPAYRALFHEGYPVKSVTKFVLFGIELDIETKLVEVSRDPVSDDAFVVPANYRKVNSLSDLF